MLLFYFFPYLFVKAQPCPSTQLSSLSLLLEIFIRIFQWMHYTHIHTHTEMHARSHCHYYTQRMHCAVILISLTSSPTPWAPYCALALTRGEMTSIMTSYQALVNLMACHKLPL